MLNTEMVHIRCPRKTSTYQARIFHGRLRRRNGLGHVNRVAALSSAVDWSDLVSEFSSTRARLCSTARFILVRELGDHDVLSPLGAQRMRLVSVRVPCLDIYPGKKLVCGSLSSGPNDGHIVPLIYALRTFTKKSPQTHQALHILRLRCAVSSGVS